MKLPIAILSTSLLAAGAAYAESDQSFFQQKMSAPSGAFELTIASGFSVAEGKLERGVGLGDSGDTFDLELAYRLSPHMSIGWYGSFTDFGAFDTSGTEAIGLSTGLQARWHLAPFRAFDPWISAGGGFHAYIVDREMDDGLAYLGLDLVRLQVGADFRLTPRIAVSPVIGMDITTFLRTVDEWENDRRIDDRRLSVFFFAGMAGRFDLGGSDVAPR